MFQLTYVTFYFGHISLTTKLETNWTEKDLCPPITEHHKKVTTNFLAENYEHLWYHRCRTTAGSHSNDQHDSYCMSQMEIIYAIALFDDSLRMV